MSNEQIPESIFDNLHDPFARPRKKMLPGWIKFFCWVFMISSGILVLGIPILGIVGLPSKLGIYGISTDNVFSLIGIFALLMYMVKGITGYGLIFEKDWAVKLALADGILGLASCLFVIFTGGFITTTTTATTNGVWENSHIRFEIFFIIPYIYKMWKIKDEWEENAYAREQHISGR